VSGRHSVLMYSRRTCGLCDEAREVVLAEAGRTGFDFGEIHVDGDGDLEREYGMRVPVVLVDGREEFELAVDPTRFHRLMAARGGP
jgi:glutaredoxin